MSGPYGVSLAGLGWASDRYLSHRTTCSLGLLALLASFLLVGPAPYIPAAPSYPRTLVALFLAGCANAAVFVSTFSGCQAAALDAGYEDGVTTYSLVSGLWTSAYTLGGFVGPLIGGFVYDQVGFRSGTVMVQVLAIVALVLLLCRRDTGGNRYQEIAGQ